MKSYLSAAEGTVLEGIVRQHFKVEFSSLYQERSVTLPALWLVVRHPADGSYVDTIGEIYELPPVLRNFLSDPQKVFCTKYMKVFLTTRLDAVREFVACRHGASRGLFFPLKGQTEGGIAAPTTETQKFCDEDQKIRANVMRWIAEPLRTQLLFLATGIVAA